MERAPLAAATLAGFAAAIGQIVILREMLVLFHGNELSTGIIFFCWLLWTAAGAGLARRPGPSSRGAALPAVLAMLALSLPATILLARAARLLWGIPAGQQVPPSIMLGMVLTTISIFCLASGAAFTLSWRTALAERSHPEEQPLAIYCGEAAGAGIGGLFFSFFLLPHFTALQAGAITSSILLTAAMILFLHLGRFSPRPRWQILLLAAVLGVAAFSAASRLEGPSRRWQWGGMPLAVRDTPFHNLALLKTRDQISLFSNGLWLFSVPDPQNAELAAHLPLLQHPHPESVLLIGGAQAGLVGEILKYPRVRQIDCVEPDPEVVRMSGQFLPGSVTAPLRDPRVQIHHEDARTFLRRGAQGYDIVILDLGEPLNAEMNGFYTVEFFSRVNRLMKEGGVFSLAVPSSPDIIGPAQARLLQSIHSTLKVSFASVLAIPGESARFFASPSPSALTADPRELAGRISERKLDVRYVRDDFLFDAMNPLRLDYMLRAIESAGPGRLNRDFEPTCYFNAILVWAAQLDPILERTMIRFTEAGDLMPWIALGALVLWGIFRKVPAERGTGVVFNVALAGGIQMSLEIALLLGFQILEGFVYSQLAAIISATMAGLALGAAVLARFRPNPVKPVKSLAILQAVISLYCVGIMGLLRVLHDAIQSGQSPAVPTAWIFSGLALSAGLLGGLHFSLATKAVGSLSPRPGQATGARLYAWDTAGAAAGALIASLFLLPVYGITDTLRAVSLLSLGGIAALGGRSGGKLNSRRESKGMNAGISP
ncbi:MAG: hypothetical protein ABFD98_12585 [Syntrophobacteraceae bacterium]|nr:hypothetical protein [Desulfobacteraceae bacterium]